MARYRSLRDFDWPLLIMTLILCALGVIQIYSATHDDTAVSRRVVEADPIYRRGAGADVGGCFGRLPYADGPDTDSVRLFHCDFAGDFAHRQARPRRHTVDFCRPFNFQASEFVKLVIILVVARYLAELKSDEVTIRDLLKLGGLVGIPTALVMAQPDFSTGATYVPILIVGILLAGMQWRHVVMIVLALRPGGAGMVVRPQGFQKERLLTFRDPSHDPQGRGYQVIQSKIAVGDGGMWGRGVTHGTQTQLRFLPLPHTDFIFAAFAEEHGFIWWWWCWDCIFFCSCRSYRMPRRLRIGPGVYICMGVATLLLFHVLVNVGWWWATCPCREFRCRS